ncbi:diaminopimelate epimerase [Alkalicaulis satelles]|uniref:Diaminopimelate epimerase n=2 Tax=Alkalicaulis satelles TaxID=2609175 RepID=A0A5M6ZH48_9PROT|nr:diaminopimelate epimerase [Alkalicaulis satelles]
MNGAGNAFILIDARGAPAPLAPAPDAVLALAESHAFDQLLALEADEGADARLRVWNRDGGEVGACGNGTRAAAWLMFQESGADRLALASAGGPMAARRRSDGGAEVDLGPARLDWREIPLARQMDTVRLDYGVDLPGGGRLEGPGAVSMGNPHAVFFVDDPDALPLHEIGPRIEHDRLFPERVNAGFAAVLGPDLIRLKVWERGAGLTQACGTGAAAALVAACRQGRIGRQAVIRADGGDLPVRWSADGHVHLAGPVVLEGAVKLPSGFGG